jgi:hypothetical protein
MIVVRTVEWAEQALGSGEIGCPRPGCGGALTRWGYGRLRRVRSLGARTLECARGGRDAPTVPQPDSVLPAALQPRLAPKQSGPTDPGGSRNHHNVDN